MPKQTRHKLIILTKRKKTRKMKGGGLGLKMPSFFKSKPAAAPVAPSRPDNNTTVTATAVIQTSAKVAAVTTLGSIAMGYLGNPTAIAAIAGFATASTGGALGGVVILCLVAAAAWMVLKEKQKKYKGLILVMDELYLVIQKLNGIIEVSIHIAEAYGFPVDTRDVQLALDAILAKFDELLVLTTDYDPIKNSLANFRKLRADFNAKGDEVKAELENAAGSEDDASSNPPKISLWTKTKDVASGVAKSFKKNIWFSSETYVQELNEAVTYLALYVGIFSASFSTTYTTVVVQLLMNGKTKELLELQTKVFNDPKFNDMVEGAVVYPLLQSQKTYKTCMLKSSDDSSCGSTFIAAAESMRQSMERLFDKEKNPVSSDLYNAMTNLKKVSLTTPITTADGANQFADAVDAAFKNDKAALTAAALTASGQIIQKPVASPATTEQLNAAPATTAQIISKPVESAQLNAAPATSEQITTDNNVQQQQQL
jgi:hypothetical protein